MKTKTEQFVDADLVKFTFTSRFDGHRSRLEQRMEILKNIYRGANNPMRIGATSGLNNTVTKEILISLARKNFIRLTHDGDGKTKGTDPSQPYNRRHFAHLAITLTEQGERVMFQARSIKRQLLDEAPDFN